MPPQVLDGAPDGLQRHTSVKEPLRDAKRDQVLEGVDAPGPSASGLSDRRPDQTSSSPVVELPVRGTLRVRTIMRVRAGDSHWNTSHARSLL